MTRGGRSLLLLRVWWSSVHHFSPDWTISATTDSLDHQRMNPNQFTSSTSRLTLCFFFCFFAFYWNISPATGLTDLRTTHLLLITAISQWSSLPRHKISLKLMWSNVTSEEKQIWTTIDVVSCMALSPCDRFSCGKQKTSKRLWDIWTWLRGNWGLGCHVCEL